MNNLLREILIDVARKRISDNDVSHDVEHALRVLANAEKIAETENADLDILVPAALFHDLVVYPKDHPDVNKSQEESAAWAAEILAQLEDYPKEKIPQVQTCILECSFSRGIIPELLESKILQDADGLEATGAISIMRTYSSTGQMKRKFYHPEDPFCEHREAENCSYGLDLFYTRLLKVEERMHTTKAKAIAKERTNFLKIFLEQVRKELDGE